MTVKITRDTMYKLVQFTLLVAILGLLLWSQPWSSTNSDEVRKLSVRGEATVQAVPDEFVFYPYLEKSGPDRDALRTKLTEQANTVVNQLKELGVDENKIALDASSYDNWYVNEGEDGNMRVSLTITLADKDKAQEVQDYLLTLDNLKGQISPQANFSKAKQKELESQATDLAIEDAAARASQQAGLVGAEIGDVLEVGQSSGAGFPVAFSRLEAADLGSEASSLPVLPGENEYRIDINVTYELR